MMKSHQVTSKHLVKIMGRDWIKGNLSQRSQFPRALTKTEVGRLKIHTWFKVRLWSTGLGKHTWVWTTSFQSINLQSSEEWHTLGKRATVWQWGNVWTLVPPSVNFYHPLASYLTTRRNLKEGHSCTNVSREKPRNSSLMPQAQAALSTQQREKNETKWSSQWNGYSKQWLWSLSLSTQTQWSAANISKQEIVIWHNR